MMSKIDKEKLKSLLDKLKDENTDIEKELERLKVLGAKVLEEPLVTPEGAMLAFIETPYDKSRVEIVQSL